jgi:hypothetical protein
LPSQVNNEDWATIQSIMEFRLLRSAQQQHNEDASKLQPAQVEIWKEMVEAVESDG